MPWKMVSIVFFCLFRLSEPTNQDDAELQIPPGFPESRSDSEFPRERRHHRGLIFITQLLHGLFQRTRSISVPASSLHPEQGEEGEGTTFSLTALLYYFHFSVVVVHRGDDSSPRAPQTPKPRRRNVIYLYSFAPLSFHLLFSPLDM